MKSKVEQIVSTIMLVIPFIMIAVLWSEIPDTIPIHWNIHGEVDRWGSRAFIFLLPLINIGVYLLFMAIPHIDPKKRIEEFGNLYNLLRFIVVSLMFGLFVIILMATLGYIDSANWIIYPIFFMILILGNIMGKVKPNYFIGVRTPWTLENEEVWRKTHRLTGYLWVFSSLVALLISFILPREHWLYLILPYCLLIAIVPIAYSYIVYARLEKE